MFSLISICYERYGSQDYEDYESLENLVLKITNELCDIHQDSRVAVEIKTKNNHMVVKDNDMMEYIITGVSFTDQIKIKEMLKINCKL